MSNDANKTGAGMSATISNGGYSASYGGGQMSGQATYNSGAGPTDPAAVKDVTTASFAEDVIEASKNHVVLIDFWAPWCGPCKQLGPLLEKTVAASNGKAVLTKMDIDKHPEIAGQMGIKSIPAVVAVVDGKPVDAFMGAVPESQIKAFIDKQPSPANPASADDGGVEAAMQQATELLQAGDSAEAAEIYASVLTIEPGNLDAIAGLGECYLAVNELEHARKIVASLPEDQLKVPTIAAFVGKLELAEQTASLGSVEDLEKKVQKNPKDHQNRFDLALALNAKGQRQDAAEQLLEIVRTDRKWQEDGAREQLLQFFEIWGPVDDATLTGRRALSSILFS